MKYQIINDCINIAIIMSQFLSIIRFRGAKGFVATFEPNSGLYEFKPIEHIKTDDLVVIGLNPITNYVTLATVYCNIAVECNPTTLYEVFTREENSTDALTLLSEDAYYAEAMIKK